MSKNRLQYDKPTYYCNKVLLGNWFEENLGSYKKCKFRHNSSYRHDFTPKTSQDKKFNDEMRNHIQIKSERSDNILPSKIDDEIPNYFDNYTTTYDLSYQYFPTWLNGVLKRTVRFKLLKSEPMEEYLNSYGNLSKRSDLTENKMEEWECDILDPRRSALSTAQISFPKYDDNAYRCSRWPRLTPVKIKCGPVTQKIYKEYAPDHPRAKMAQCNPITWECDQRGFALEKCVCKR